MTWKEYKYWFFKTYSNQDPKGCGPVLMMYGLMVACLLLGLCGCRTVKKSVDEKESTSDSVRIEYIEKVIKVPVTVYVEVPAELKEKMTRDSTSHLETGFAVSDASMIWIDGVAFLRHSLANKPQKIGKTDSVFVVEKEKTVWKTRRVTYTKTVTLEKQLTRWERIRLDYGGYAIILILLLISYGFYWFIKKILPRWQQRN